MEMHFHFCLFVNNCTNIVVFGEPSILGGFQKFMTKFYKSVTIGQVLAEANVKSEFI